MKEQNEEISVWEIISFFKRIVTYSKKLLTRISIFWVGLFILGYIYYSIAPKRYQSEMYVSTQNLNREELSSQIVYLNKLIYYNSYDELATLLGVSPKDATLLQSFSIEPYVIEEPSSENETRENTKNTPSRIIVRSKSNETYALLNKTLTDYLNNTAYSEMLNGSQKEKLIKLKNTYTAELKKLDSLENKSSNYRMRKDDELGFLFDGPSEIAKARISLIEKIAQTEKDLKTDIGVKVIKEFYYPSHPYYFIKISYLIFMYILLVIISYLMASFFMIMKAKLNEYERTKAL